MAGPRGAPPIIGMSAVGKLSDPQIPVLMKQIMGPERYSQSGYTVDVGELPDVLRGPLTVLGPILGNSGAVIIPRAEVNIVPCPPGGEGCSPGVYEPVTEINIHFYKVKVDSGDGSVTYEELPDGSDELDGVVITILAFGDATTVEHLSIPPEGGVPGQ